MAYKSAVVKSQGGAGIMISLSAEVRDSHRIALMWGDRSRARTNFSLKKLLFQPTAAKVMSIIRA